jgi:hypothetical protein
MPKLKGSTVRHIRVATVFAFLVANLTLVGVFAPSATAAQEVYGFSCCGGGFGTVNYHPGETIKVDWIQTAIRLTGAPAIKDTLSAHASGPFPTITAAKKALTGSHPVVGRTVFSATTLHVSDEKKASPVALLKVPSNAATGFYAFTFKIVKGKATGGGGLIFTVLP